MTIKPLGIRVDKRGNVMRISGFARSARGTKFTTKTIKVDVAGLDHAARSKAIEAAVNQIMGLSL